MTLKYSAENLGSEKMTWIEGKLSIIITSKHTGELDIEQFPNNVLYLKKIYLYSFLDSQTKSFNFTEKKI